MNIGREGRGVERDGKVCEGDAIRFALRECPVLPPIGKGREGVPWGVVLNSRTLSCLPCHASYREFAECPRSFVPPRWPYREWDRGSVSKRRALDR